MEAKRMEAVRILLVDDEPEIPRVLAKRLARRGYVCATARNGGEALDLMRDSLYAIVILDVKMPVMGGMEALEHIVRNWPRTRIIILSGHADAHTAVQAIAQGAFGYLMKPVEFDELLFKIEDALTDIELAGE
jgi:DNA-binding NtrC family response regulator